MTVTTTIIRAPWAARYNTWLLIKLKGAKGKVFSFLLFSYQGRHAAAAKQNDINTIIRADMQLLQNQMGFVDKFTKQSRPLPKLVRAVSVPASHYFLHMRH